MPQERETTTCMKVPDSVQKIFVVIALSIFLLFVGMSVYPILYPVHHWDVECFRGKVRTTWTALTNEYQVKQFTDGKKERGEDKCVVFPVRALRLW